MKQLRLAFVCFVILFLFASTFVNGQRVDSVAWARNRTQYYYDKANSFELPVSYRIDTIIKSLEQYNPSFNRNRLSEWMGNIGRPSKRIVFEPRHTVGFDYGVHSFDDLLFNNYTQPYYQVRKPYTSLFYLSGPEKEEILQVIHSQNINKTWNVGINFRVMDSWGSYQWQSCDNRQLMVNTNYVAPLGKYRVLAAYYHSSIEIQENGGVSDSIFENKLTTQTLSVPVYLQAANNQYKETGFFVKQIYNFKRMKVDSIPHRTFNPGSISLTLHYYKNSQTYSDLDGKSGYYRNIYFDTTATHDSIHFRWFESNFAWTNGISENPLSPQAFNLVFGIRHKYIEYIDTFKIQTFNHITPYAALSVFAFGKFHLDLNGEYVIGDYNGGDFSLKAVAKFDFLKKHPGKILFTSGLFYTQKEADWFYTWRYSNYFKWKNDFDKQNLITYFAKLKIGTFNADVSLHQLNNFVYLSNNAKPEWQDNMIHVLVAKLSKDISWGRLQIDNDLVYQYTPDHSIIKLPQIAAMQSWYLNLQLFKKYMYLQPGVSFYYNTSYFADDYMPSTRMFYTQETKQIGNYVYADVFANVQIKRANVFLKYQHINSGWTNYNFYMMPHYPQQASALKLGVIWRFYD